VSASPVLVQEIPPSTTGSMVGPDFLSFPEMRFLIGAVSQGMQRRDRFVTVNADEIDWTCLLQLADVHGVAPMLCRSLDSAPRLISDEALVKLRSDFQNTARANLVRVRELLRVVSALQEASITVVPYKGPVLAAVVYGDVTLREFSDLDLLVQPADVPRARKVMAQLGYVPEQLLSSGAERKYLRSACEYNFKHKELGILLELHWQILPRQFSLQFDVERIWSRLGATALGTSQVLCLNTKDLLVVLCAHAGKHLWTRLIWIADVTGLILRNPDIDWEAICSHSQEIGAERILFISLAIAGRIFALPLPEEVERLIIRDREAGRVAQGVIAQLWNRETKPISTVRHHLTLLSARENWADRYRYAYRTISAGIRTRVSFSRFQRQIT